MPGGFSGVSGVCFHFVMNHTLTDLVAGGRGPLIVVVKGHLEIIGLIEQPDFLVPIAS